MEEKINQVLESIGLNKNEVKIYLDLIRYSRSSALDISKRTHIHRSNTYDAIRKLIDRGFVNEIIEEKKKMFKAVGPEKIKDFVRQQELEIDSIIPMLNQFCSFSENNGSTIMTCKGIFALRESLADLLNKNQDIYILGAPHQIINTLGLGFIKEFHRIRIKKKIQMNHIYNQDAMDRIKVLNKMKYTEARCLEKKYQSSVVTTICGDTVLLYIFTNPVTTIVIKDQAVAESYRNHFLALWSRAKVPKNISNFKIPKEA